MGIPFSSASFEADKLMLGLSNMAASYEGTLQENGDNIHGVWSQGGASIDLNMARIKEDASIR